MELLYKLLDLIGWMIGISLVLVCVFVGVRALYRLYLRFNEKTEENGDKIERLLPPPAAEKKKNLNRKKKEHLLESICRWKGPKALSEKSSRKTERIPGQCLDTNPDLQVTWSWRMPMRKYLHRFMRKRDMQEHPAQKKRWRRCFGYDKTLVEQKKLKVL